MAEKKALLMADVQNDFLPGGALGVPEGDRIVPKVNEYIRRFTGAGLPVFLTRDWHPPGTKHFNTQGGPWPPHCVQGTPGAAFAPGLDVPDSAVIVSKGMDPNKDSYSAFDAEGADGRPLDDLLRERGVMHLYIGGLATDYCVRFSALDAQRRGYKVTVVEDAIRGIDQEGSRRTLEEIAAAGGRLITLERLDVAAAKANE